MSHEKTDLRSPTVCVTGLPTTLSDGDFEKWVASFGVPFFQSMVIRDIEGRNQRYAFACFENHTLAREAARRIDGGKLGDCVITATVGQNPPRRARRVA